MKIKNNKYFSPDDWVKEYSVSLDNCQNLIFLSDDNDSCHRKNNRLNLNHQMQSQHLDWHKNQYSHEVEDVHLVAGVKVNDLIENQMTAY